MCLFPIIINDTNIIGPPSLLGETFKYLALKFNEIGLSI
jgi:hypothetical protein